MNDSHTLTSLVFVVQRSTEALRSYLAGAENAQTEASVKAIVDEADVLSGALSRLHPLMDQLPAKRNPAEERDILPIVKVTELLTRIRAATELGFCKECGGLSPPRNE